MIYADYARRKMHNAVKLGNAEGYPLVINNAEGKKLKDYTIEGNTEYGENLFNYDTKANEFTVDKDGWMTTTLDNKTGTYVKYRWVYDKPCTLIKPDTNYYIYTQIETFDVESIPTASDTDCYLYAKSEPNPTAAYSQFVRPSLRYKAAGIYKATITSRSDFSGCTFMLRTYLNATPGVKITVKFRIAVYEAEKDVFLPYTKTSVGNMTETNKYAIPIMVNGENNTTIYLNSPLADGESINYKADNLPDIVLNKGTNTITTGTAVKPKKIIAKYYKK